MATIKFYTRTKLNKPAPVYIRYSNKDTVDIRMKTGFEIKPPYWDVKAQDLNMDALKAVKEKGTEAATEEARQEAFKEFDHYVEVGEKLRSLRNHIERAEMKVRGSVNQQWLKRIIDSVSEKRGHGVETLNDFIERFISEAERGDRKCKFRKQKKPYSKETLRTYRDFQHIFNTYQGIETSPKLDKDGKPKEIRKSAKYAEKRPYNPLNFEDMTEDTYKDFVKFFTDNNCSQNYIGKHIKTLKAILGYAGKEKTPLHTWSDKDRKAFEVLSEDTTAIYLTAEELMQMNNLYFDDSQKHLEKARDIFLCGCFTAQRWGDYSRINKDMMQTKQGKNVINFGKQQKTGEEVMAPRSPIIEAILQKYDYTLPKMSQQEFNRYIKKVGKLAGITEDVFMERRQGDLTAPTKHKKYELIASHTARRTGCTLMIKNKVPLISAMKISGHRTEKQFLEYVKMTNEEVAVELADNSFFMTAPPLRIAK